MPACCTQSRAQSPSPSDRIELNVSSDPANLAAVRKAVEAFCCSHGLNDQACENMGLCINEAMANVIRHAYKGATDRPIRVDAIDAEGKITVQLRDWGNGVNPATLPEKKKDPMTPGGVGLVCLAKMMDQVLFTPQPDGMLLTLVKRK